MSKDKLRIAKNIESSNQSQSGNFEINSGQFDADFKYRFTNSTGCVDFYKDKIAFSLRKVTRAFDPKKLEDPMLFEYVNWDIYLLGSKTNRIHSLEESNVSNVTYFGSRGEGISRESVSSIIYEGVYENIDLKFYKNEEGQLKYDFILKPGALVSDIKLKYDGVSNLHSNENGTLEYDTDWGPISEDKPFSYLIGTNAEVEISYLVDGDILTFDAETNEITETTVLDPIYVDWSSYFYGTGNNGLTWSYTWVYDLDIDEDNNLYVAGLTNDRFPDIPDAYDTTVNGNYDAFVCKMSPEGDSILWLSYLGGNNAEYCFTLGVNADQEPVIAGFTWSEDFPVTSGAYDNIPNIGNGGFRNNYAGYVSKFSKDGKSLIFSTFLGGTGSELIQSLILDASGSIYLTGQTNSSDYPTTAGAYQTTYGGSSSGSWWWNGGDAFLTKMKADGSDLEFSTFLGGSSDDVAYQVALSSKNEIYVVGKTGSGDFPKTPGSKSVFNGSIRGLTDGFITKFSPDGKTLEYSKLMGGNDEDWFEGVYVNEQDQAYVAGISRSADFYVSKNAFQKRNNGGADAVVVKFNPGGQNVIYSTYLGGSGDEVYYSGWIYNSNVRIAANVKDEAIICGITRSDNFPVTSDALMLQNPSATNGGWWNSAATITKLDYFGSNQLYGTYYGGSSYEVPGANKLKRISCFTNILYGGFTNSSDYPTTVGVYKENKVISGTGFFWTGFISKFRDTLYTDEINLSLGDTVLRCDKLNELVDAKNRGADILWSDGSTRSVNFLQDTGFHWVQATYGCDTVRDTIYLQLEYSPKLPVLPRDTTYCDLFPTIPLNAYNDSVDATFMWSNGSTDSAITLQDSGNYWVDIITPNCGTERDLVHLDFKRTPEPEFSDSIFCDDVNILLVGGDSVGNGERYLWNTGDTTESLYVDTIGVYKVVVSNYCGEDSTSAEFFLRYSPEITLPVDSEFCNTVDWVLDYGREDNDEAYVITELESGQAFLTDIDSFRINNPGKFKIKIQNICGVAEDSVEASKIISPVVDLGVDSTFCDQIFHPILVGTSDNKENYRWQDNVNTAQRDINTEGKCWVEISNKCSTVSDTVIYKLVKTPTASLPEDSVFCDVVSIVLDASISEPSLYQWNTGSPDSAIIVSTIGKYKVTVSNYCGEASDSMEITMLETPRVELGEVDPFCGAVTSKSFTVGKDNNESYLWSNGDVLNTTTYLTEGKHWIRIGNKCGEASDTIDFVVSPNPTVSLIPDTTLCGDFSVTLDAGNPGMSYVWEPYDETTQIIQATEQLIYRVTVYNENGCEGSDEMEIRPDCVSKFLIPEAFTPNNDGLNDVFKPTLVNYQEYTLLIYNRWGEKIFESSDADIGWDGTFKGLPVQMGVYTYVMRFKTTENLQWQNLGGVINLLR